MAIRQSLVTVALSLAGALCVLLLLGHLDAPRDAPVAGGQDKIDRGQLARDIASGDPGVIAVLGPDHKEIGGIIWNESVADVFYEAKDRFYRVEISYKPGKVTSIREESDPEVLAWLTNVSVTAEPFR